MSSKRMADQNLGPDSTLVDCVTVERSVYRQRKLRLQPRDEGDRGRTRGLRLVREAVPRESGPAPPFARSAPLNLPDRGSFYGGDDRGYIDYPFLEEPLPALRRIVLAPAARGDLRSVGIVQHHRPAVSWARPSESSASTNERLRARVDVVGDACSHSNQSPITKKPKARPAVYRNRPYRGTRGPRLLRLRGPRPPFCALPQSRTGTYNEIARAFCVGHLTGLPSRNCDDHIKKKDEEWDHRGLIPSGWTSGGTPG